ncbi:hypothetical protein YC2023_083189 [Brassica napus]
MAPEYALWGHLTEKADVFSFGVVAMEIVSGKSNMKRKGSDDHVSLINWALTLHQRGDIMEIVDPVLQGDFNSKEAVRMIKVAFLCTNSSPSLRPTMSEAVKMLEGEINIREVMSDPGLYGHNWSISNLNIDTHGSSSVSGVAHQTATTMQSSLHLYHSSCLKPYYICTIQETGISLNAYILNMKQESDLKKEGVFDVMEAEKMMKALSCSINTFIFIRKNMTWITKNDHMAKS